MNLEAHPRLCSFLADLILVVHSALAAFLVLGLVVIWVGFVLRWSFVRNFYFRMAHLLTMGFVAWEAVTGRICPLTVWEDQLRLLAGGGRVYQGSFIQHWLHKILFFEASEATFRVIYVLFFALICLSFWFVTPRLPGRKKLSSNP